VDDARNSYSDESASAKHRSGSICMSRCWADAIGALYSHRSRRSGEACCGWELEGYLDPERQVGMGRRLNSR
jgi:hypothetical protein